MPRRLVGEAARKGQMEGGRRSSGALVTEKVLSDMPAGRPRGTGLLLAQAGRLACCFD